MAIELQIETAAGEMQAGRSARDRSPGLLKKRAGARRTKPKPADRMMFTEGLALQLESGVPLHLGLQSLQAQIENPAMQEIIAALAQSVIEGSRFSEALARHPQLFSLTYVNLVAVSENGGFLPKVLAQLADMDEKQERLRSSLISALSYPAFLMAFSAGVVIFILAAVFPQFSVMFGDIYAELPITTKALMAMSKMLTAYPLPLAAGLVLLAVAAVPVLKRPGTQAWVDRMKLRVPMLKEIFIGVYLTRLLRTMGVSLQHGVTILATLKACREVIANAEFQSFILALEDKVTQGQQIAAGFRQAHFIPASVLQMIATGEQAGELGLVMTRIADFYDRELTKRLNQIAKLAEPVMLLVMGGIVGIVVSSLILPIFKLSRALH